MKLWRDHSLTIVLVTAGVLITGYSLTYDDANGWDFWLGLGQNLLGVALLFFLSQWFREVAKPEDPVENDDD